MKTEKNDFCFTGERSNENKDGVSCPPDERRLRC
jgi:hypothetical protein